MSSSFGAPAPGPRLRTLAGLADYACAHTGSCCRAGWPIPIESTLLDRLRDADAGGRLTALSGGTWEEHGILCHTPESTCVFHEIATGRPGCRLEIEVGAAGLPHSCRQFPRILLRDSSGWHLSLSAWCGTAARLIASGQTVTHRSPPDLDYGATFLSFAHISVSPRVHVEGLDAHDAWPPLLRPGVLAGHDAYAQWEEGLLTRYLGRGEATLARRLADAIDWTERVRNWRPEGLALSALIAETTEGHLSDDTRIWHMPDSVDPEGVLRALMNYVPPDWRVADWPHGLIDADLAGHCLTAADVEASLARYLGTRLMASWVAYQGQGLRSVLASLVSAYALAVLALSRTGTGGVTFGRMTSALRASDWLLLHLLDREQWAEWCVQYESPRGEERLLGTVATTDNLLRSLSFAPA